MMDFEKNLEEAKEWYKNRITTTIHNLEQKGFLAYYADNKNEALYKVQSLIREQSAYFEQPKPGDLLEIGIADSMSLHQINLFEWLYQQENIIIHNAFERLDDGRFSEFEGQPNDWISSETYNVINRRTWEKARKALLSDIFITGVNAITMDGTLVSTDGAGNRIAGVIYGPYRVILVVGRNKIVENVSQAIDRVKNIATPLNHLRHSVKHRIQGEKAEKNYGIYKLGELPCVNKGHCVDCNASLCTRHCTMIMERPTGGLFKDRVHVILVNEELGL